MARSLARMGIPALPYSGGYLEQPEWLMDDLMALNNAWERLVERKKADG